MKVKDVLVMGLLVAAVLVLIRVIVGAPFVQRVRESFANGGQSLLNSMTECPANSKMYMYEGVAYCCSARINPDADTVTATCRANPFDKEDLTFCTLGPSTDAVKNCMESRAGILQALGEKVCPPSKPNLVLGTVGSPTQLGRCCATAANESMTDCLSVVPGWFCDVSSNANMFEAPNACAFERAKEMAPACPSGYGAFTGAGQGPLAGLTIFGCQDSNQICYAQSTINSLKQMGYDVSGMTAC